MNRNELNRQRTIEDIKNSFIKLYDAEGIDKVTAVSICRNIDISKTVFYRYFEDKYAVLEEIENEIIQKMVSINKNLDDTCISEYKKGKPFPVFVETATYIKEQEKYFRPLLGPHGDPSFIFRWKKIMKADIKRKFEIDRIAGCNMDAVGELCAGGLIGLYTYWFFENPGMTAEEISAIGGMFISGSFYNFK